MTVANRRLYVRRQKMLGPGWAIAITDAAAHGDAARFLSIRLTAQGLVDWHRELVRLGKWPSPDWEATYAYLSTALAIAPFDERANLAIVQTSS